MDAEIGEVIECLETVAVCRLAGVNRSTLDYWVRTGLVSPSLRTSPGRRRTRLWTVRDAVVVRTIAALRESGCALHQVRRARDAVTEQWGSFGSDATLVWTGSDVLRIGPEGEVESLLRRPRQQAFRAVALPLSVWRDQTGAEVLEIGADRIADGVAKRRVATR
ncbi:MAG: MerR family transcriptional regulator [Candidatus Limnocylindrales bacterium]